MTVRCCKPDFSQREKWSVHREALVELTLAVPLALGFVPKCP